MFDSRKLISSFFTASVTHNSYGPSTISSKSEKTDFLPFKIW
jgi:hypothetical protein